MRWRWALSSAHQGDIFMKRLWHQRGMKMTSAAFNNQRRQRDNGMVA